MTWFLIISADIIFTLEIASLLHVFSQPIAILLIQGCLSGLIVLINKMFRVGFPKISSYQLKSNINVFFHYLNTNRLLTVFGMFIIINSLLLIFCIARFPQNITDSLYNHLSRIGYWIQQDSLKHYSAFNIVGMVYPYNNSLLMSLTMVMLKSDVLVGFVQFAAAWVCVVSIYIISRDIGFRRESSLFAGLMVLTYVVIIYESITAQNDLLVAAFSVASFAFLVSFIRTKNRKLLIISLLAFALALGTNQYALLVFPGYFILFIFSTIHNKKLLFKDLFAWFSLFSLLFFLFGSYSYVQNQVIFGNPFGPKNFVKDISNISNLSTLPIRLETNSSRLFAQFISCDGLPPQLATSCLAVKEKVLRPILSKNIESDQYLYGTTQFELVRPNVYNAETAWYGPISWILILPSIAYTLLNSIRKKNILNLLLIFTPLSFFVLIQIAKHGWDLYQGRYLITAVVLIQPFTAWIFESRKLSGKIITGFICLSAIFIMVFSTLNNVSLPLISKNMMVRLELWGKVHSTLVQKIAYKTKPLLMAEKDAWKMSHIELMTISSSKFINAVTLVEMYVPLDGSLGIVSGFNEFPDYLLRGSQVQRRLERIVNLDTDVSNSKVDFILTAPDNIIISIPGFQIIDQMDGWVIFQNR